MRLRAFLILLVAMSCAIAQVAGAVPGAAHSHGHAPWAARYWGVGYGGYGLSYPTGTVTHSGRTMTTTTQSAVIPAAPPIEPQVLKGEAAGEGHTGVFLSDLRFKVSGANRKDVGINQEAPNMPLSIGEEDFASGFALPANSTVSVKLPREFHTLHAVFGADEVAVTCKNSDEEIRIAVLLNGSQAFISEPLHDGEPPQEVSLPIEGRDVAFKMVGGSSCLRGIVAMPRAE